MTVSKNRDRPRSSACARVDLRARLSGERIETEALALIDKDGVHALTMRKLCNRLGCGKASMNLLFPSKGHILDALDDRVLRDIPIPDK